MKRIKTLAGDVYMASDVDALLASHVVATDQSNLQALHDRIAELEKALQRLASPEAFDVSRAIDPERDKELLMRMEYANTSLMGS